MAPRCEIDKRFVVSVMPKERGFKRAEGHNKREDIQMPSQSGEGGRGGPWGSGPKSGSDIEELVRQGQHRLTQILPSGGLRPTVLLAALALVGLVAWTT